MSPPRTSAAPDTAEQRFHALYADVHGDVLRFVSRRLSNEAVSSAEDVVADALLVAWRRFEDAPRRPDAQRAWVFGIARNCLLTARRGSGRREALAVRLAGAGDPVSSDPHDGLVAALDLAAAWRRLDPGQQEVLALTVFEELTSAQAALVLGTTSTAYRLCLMRARRALRSHLIDAEDPEPAAGARHPHHFVDDALEATR